MVYTQIKTYLIMGKDYVSANVAYCTKQNTAGICESILLRMTNHVDSRLELTLGVKC